MSEEGSGVNEVQSKSFNIEVGPRDNPLIWALREDLLPSQSGRAFYIDKEHTPLQNLKSENERDVDVWSMFRTDPKPLPVQGDAAHIPVADNSSNLIMASNLFGADDHLEMDVDKGGFKGMLRLPEWSDIVTEWNRVLTRGGKVVILENLTPPKTTRLTNMFSEHGFVLNEENRAYNAGKIFGDKRISVAMSTMESYSLVFEKKSDDSPTI